MSERWELRAETDNAGRPFKVWIWDEYELSQNVNLGNEGGWVFELTFKGRHLALAPSLCEGKQVAHEHRASLEAGRSRDEAGFEVAS